MNAPALVLLHGYPFDHTLWDHVVPLLEKDLKVLVPDLPGFGTRTVLEAPPDLDTLAEDLASTLEKEGLPRVVLAGMSMGGYVALAFAEHSQEMLAGISLVSSQTAADSEETRKSRRDMIEQIRTHGVEVAAKAAAQKMFAPQHKDRPELHRFPLWGAERSGVEGLCWAMEAMAARPDRTQLFRGLTIPKQIIHGTDDQLIPVERARQLAAEAHAQFDEIPDAGHATPIEAPSQVAQALKRFVSECIATESAS